MAYQPFFNPEGIQLFVSGNDVTVAGVTRQPRGEERVKAGKWLMANETVHSVKNKLRGVREDTS